MRENATQARFTVPPTLEAHDSTLVDILRWRVLNQPERHAYTFLIDGENERVQMTYAELDRQARSIAATLQQCTGEGDRALLLYPPGLDYIAAFLGCLYAGVIAVPAYPPSSNRSLLRIQAIASDARAAAVLATEQIVEKLQHWTDSMPELNTMALIATDTLKHTPELSWQPFYPDPDALAFLQYTSGSTGTPKGVMVSHSNLIHNLSMARHRWELSPSSVGVSWLPIFHDLGLIAGILQPLFTGFPAILMAPATFIQRPWRWLQAISHYRGTVSCAPNFAYELCIRKISPEERARLDLRSWQIALNGAEPVRKETLERFAETFAPCGFRAEAHLPAYGLAEGTLVVSSVEAHELPSWQTVDKEQIEQHVIVPVDPTAPTAYTLVSCGAPSAGQRVAIVHPQTLTQCSAEQVGEIWVSGGSVTQGYWGRLRESQATFSAFLADTGDGPYLRTGDLGFYRDGHLFITGRHKDVIIIDGRNHYPQDIEVTAHNAHPAVHTGGCAAFSVEVDNSEQLVIAAEIDRHYRPVEPVKLVEQHDGTGENVGKQASAKEITRAILQAIAEEHEMQVYAVVLLKAGGLPKTSSGKVQRYACRQGFLQQSLTLWGEN